ncbi:ATP-binding protein [Caulobacter segnis]
MSLAHNGVLFLDELPEFGVQALDSLRAPLETGEVMVARANFHIRYPARVQLVAAMNPCRCGHGGAGRGACGKAPRCQKDYQGRVSGPLMDRIDLAVDMPAVTAADLSLPPPAEGSAEVAARVARAQALQQDRADELGAADGINGRAEGAFLETITALDDRGRALLAQAAEAGRLSARAGPAPCAWPAPSPIWKAQAASSASTWPRPWPIGGRPRPAKKRRSPDLPRLDIPLKARRLSSWPMSDPKPTHGQPGVTPEQLATLSHEFRTPLNGVLGMARLLEKHQADGRAAVLRHRPARERRSPAVAGQRRAALRPPGRGLDRDLSLAPVDVEGLAAPGRRADEPARPREGALEIAWIAPSPLPVIRADEGRLRQILLNSPATP